MPRLSTNQIYRRWGSGSLALTQLLILVVAVGIATIASGSWVMAVFLGGAGVATMLFNMAYYRVLLRRREAKGKG
jgi:hypothetical protein